MGDEGASPFRWSFGLCAQATSPGRYSSAAATEGETFGGRFRIVGSLGRGGMGFVLRAHDVLADRQVAIKLQHDSLDPRKRERFLREGQLAARLRHPGILPIHGGGLTEDGRPFWVFELVEDARDLEQALAGDRERGLHLLLEVARAVAHAHAQGVVHRDLKPENVLIDAQGRVRVCDFGLAWHADARQLTQTGNLVGTPLFMAPERFSSEPGRQAPAVDVWSLGVMLYHHLTGSFPFSAESMLELMAQVQAAAPPRVRSLAPDVSPELESVCHRALARAPKERYADAAALADALEEAMDARAVEPRGPARLLAGAAAGCAALLLAGLLLASKGEPSVEAGDSPASPPPAAEVVESKQGASEPSAARALAALLAAAHRPTGFEEQVLQEFQRVRALCGDDAALSRRVELERLGYLFRRGRWEQVVAQVGPLEEDPRLGGEAVLLHALAAYELRVRDPAARKAALESCRRRWGTVREETAVHQTVGAWLAWFEEDHTVALARGRAARSLDPDLVPALLVEGLCHAKQLRLSEAASIFERARTLEPDHPSTWSASITLMDHLDRPEEAIAASERHLVLLGPAPPRVAVTDHWSRLNNLGRHTAARRFLEQALAETPGDPLLGCLLGSSLLQEGQRPLWAEHVFREAYAKAPEVVEARFLSQASEPVAARYRAIVRGARLESSSPEWAYALGEEAMAVGEDEAGVRWLREGAERGSGMAMFALGSLHAEGRAVPRSAAEAVRWYRRGADAGLALAMFNLGGCYARGEGVPPDPAEALRWFRKASQAAEDPLLRAQVQQTIRALLRELPELGERGE